eukprot:8987854-Pyramimonas_sp.AAC.1
MRNVAWGPRLVVGRAVDVHLDLQRPAETTEARRRPIARGRGAYARSGSQSREGGGHMPRAEANRTRERGICPEREPTARGRGE